MEASWNDRRQHPRRWLVSSILKERTIKCKERLTVLLVLGVLTLSVVAAGCERKDTEKPAATGAAKTESKPTKEKPRQPLIKKQEIADWCPEHGVPESVCTRCNPSLIEGFKKKSDWCKEHDLPESQCIQCHPELKEKFEAMKPKREG